MIEAFEAGTSLTACGVETDAAVAIARMREISAAFDGVAMEVGPEPLAALVAAHEAATDAPCVAMPGVEHDDMRSEIWLLMKALRAHQQVAGDGSVSSAFSPASRDLPPGFAAVPACSDPTPMAGNTAPEATGFDRESVMSQLEPREVSRGGSAIARADQDGNGWLLEIRLNEMPRFAPGNGAFASDAPVPPPWVAQLVVSADRGGITTDHGQRLGPLTILLGSEGQHGAGAPGASWFAASAAGSVLASLPTGVSTPQDIVTDAMVAAPAGPFATLPDPISGWGMPPFGGAPSEAGARWWMVPPDSGGATRPEGRSPMAQLAGAGEMAPASAGRLPIQVHTTLHLDGSAIAHTVSEHIVDGMNGPLHGTGGFDPRRSYTPVEG